MKTFQTLQDMDRADGITSFRSEFEEHPGRKMWKEYIQAYAYLDPVEQAQHKLANSQLYIDYCDAQKYGIQVYNYRSNGGLDPLAP